MQVAIATNDQKYVLGIRPVQFSRPAARRTFTLTRAGLLWRVNKYEPQHFRQFSIEQSIHVSRLNFDVKDGILIICIGTECPKKRCTQAF